MTESELQTYLTDEDNNLSKTKEYRGYKATVTYRPTDLLILQENTSLEITDKQYQQLKEKYNKYYYFILSLSKDNKEALYSSQDYGQFSDLVQTLSFRMGQYTNLTTSEQDTVEVADYVFSRTYGMGNASTLMFVFDKEDITDDAWVQFNLQEFGLGLGRQIFRFKVDNLNDIPKLNFQIVKSQKSN
ncbi:hypothetical protein [Fulvivirga aurantia]|uniref:hypothetical protein n=1 Tax=Fulvivirga aurantia TaxID=2529383 RepID=UPI001623E23E|nr:hypothetical protein [Fulvivirga aurantia]